MAKSRSRARRERWTERKPHTREVRKPSTGQQAKMVELDKVRATQVHKASAKNYWPAVDNCDHWQVPFKLEQELEVLASAWSDRPFTSDAAKAARTIDPAIGFYLDSSWARGDQTLTNGGSLPWLDEPQTQCIIFPWPDYSVPTLKVRRFAVALTWLLDAMREGKTVETGCFGAHGRTGTMLASLLVAQGVEAKLAIARVRTTYCRKAIESWSQADFIFQLDAQMNGRELPPERQVTRAHMPHRKPIVDAHNSADYWQGAVDKVLERHDTLWESGKTPATLGFEALGEERDDDEAYNAWLNNNSLNNQSWPARPRTLGDEFGRVIHDDWPQPSCPWATECEHKATCQDEGGCLKTSMWGLPDPDGWSQDYN